MRAAIVALGLWLSVTSGRCADVDQLLSAARARQATDSEAPEPYEQLALAWHQGGDDRAAVRAATSLVDLGPRDPGLLEHAAYVLLAVGAAGRAESCARRALAERPDQPGLSRLTALALLRGGKHAAACDVLAAMLGARFPGRYADLKRVVRQDLAVVLEAWKQAEPEKASTRARELAMDGALLPGLRVLLTWETAGADVDLVVSDPTGEECSTFRRATAAGLTLQADVVEGFGPEAAVAMSPTPGDYRVGVRLAARSTAGTVRGAITVFVAGPGSAALVQVVPFTLTADGAEEPPVRPVTTVRVD